MAGRMRYIKPELRELAAFACLSDAAARLFVMLYTLADDAGRCPAGASFLAGAVFFGKPRSPNQVGRLLAELDASGLVRRYEVNGAPFLEIAGWSDKGGPTYQFIKRSHPQRYPAPNWSTETRVETRVETRSGSPDQDQDQRAASASPKASAIAAELAADSALPPGAGSLRLPPGGPWDLTIAAARERVAAGELEWGDVQRCIDSFVAKCDASAPDADRRLASWMRKERPCATKLGATKKNASRLELVELGRIPDEIVMPPGPWCIPDDRDPTLWWLGEGQDVSEAQEAKYHADTVVLATTIAGREVLIATNSDDDDDDERATASRAARAWCAARGLPARRFTKNGARS